MSVMVYKFTGVSQEDWKKWWDGLNDREKKWIQDKANWEHATLIAVAKEWGVERRAQHPS